MADDLLALQAQIEKLREALSDIREMTDPDDADNYRADDREGCFDTVFETARRALEDHPHAQ